MASKERNKMSKRRELSLHLVKDLFKGVNGMQLSRENRTGLAHPNCKSLTYGEIVPQSFVQILDIVTNNDLTSRKEFVDLGCGTGRAVFCAALYGPYFANCIGIELIGGLVAAAHELKDILAESLEAGDSRTSLVTDLNVAEHNPSHPSHSSESSADGDELIMFIISMLRKSEHNRETAVNLANRACLVLGHKKYQANLKKHKTKKFANFVQLFPDKFQLVNFGGEVIIQLKAGIPVECNILDNVTDHLTADASCDVCCSDESLDAAVGASSSLPSPLDESSPALSGDRRLLSISSEQRQLLHPMASVSFVSGDIFEIPWWITADVAYCASLLFSDAMMVALAEKVMLMKPGAWFITLKPLPDDVGGSPYPIPGIPNSDTPHNHQQLRNFTLVHDSFFKMSWQMARVYIYRVNE